MGRINMFNVSALMFAGFVGFYSGVKFFEPLVIEKLRQDGNLRSDMAFPKYDENGEAVVEEGEVAPRLYKGDQVVPLESIVAQTKPSVVEEVKKEIESKK